VTVKLTKPREDELRRFLASGADNIMGVSPRQLVESMLGEIDALREALGKINDIRDSIIGLQKINWSEHIYPLVAALDAAGFEGMDYDEARPRFASLIDRLNAAEGDVAKLREALAPIVESWSNLCRMRVTQGPPSEMAVLGIHMVAIVEALAAMEPKS
jgi:hypothetical protein